MSARAALLGLDAALLARMDVPDARRMRALDRRAIVAIGTATLAGLCLGWLADAGAVAPLVGLATGLFTWNLVRLLVGALGAPAHRGVDAVARWRPGRGGAMVLFALGAVLAQPIAAVAAGWLYPQALATRRAETAAAYEAALARTWDDDLATLDAQLAAGPGEAARALLTAERATIEAGKAAALAEDAPRVEARLARSPMFAARVGLAWEGVLGPLATGLVGMVLAIPALARRWSPGPVRAYEKLRVAAERAMVRQAWEASQAEIVTILRRWPTFSGHLRPLSRDPPFHDQPLLLGRAEGTVGPADRSLLRRHVPGYDEACTPGGRRRAAERCRLTAQAEACGDATPEQRFHQGRTLLARAEVAADAGAAGRDREAACALLSALPTTPAVVEGRVHALLALGRHEEARVEAEAAARAWPGAAGVASALSAARLAGALAAVGEERERLARAALAATDGFPPRPERGRAARFLAAELPPKGAREALALAGEAMEIGASAGGRELVLALDLAARLEPMRWDLRGRGRELALAAWMADPTPRHALDLAVMVAHVSTRAPHPDQAKLEAAWAAGLAREAEDALPEETASVLAAIALGREPPALGV